jgi:hypothetical protein
MVCAAVSIAGLGPAPAAAQRKVSERFAVRPDAFVRIHNLAGSVKVTGWDRDTVQVMGAVHEPPNGEWVIGGTAEGIKMSAWSSNPGTAVPPTHLDVRVPRNAQVWIKTASADIAVTDFGGSLDANSVTGRITVAGAPREVFTETMGGAIEVDATTRALRARTASGDIRIRGAIREVTATTVSGSLTIEGDHFERGTFESVDSDIRYFGNVGRASVLDFKNHGGAIEFLLPGDASAEFTISTFAGGFDDQYGVRANVLVSKLKGQEVRFALGSGGGQVSVLSFKGRVTLRKKG